MSEAEHRKPCESRGSRTVLGARGGEIPSRDSPTSRNSGFIVLSGDVVHLEENFEKNRVPSLNTDMAESIASMEKIRQMIAAYKTTLFINHDKPTA